MIARAKEIFLDAIELPADQQAPFVQRACDGDDTLRAQVESLLRTHHSRPGVLAGPAAPPRQSEQPGDMIDRYRLVRLLGEGGFGSVFLAQQTEPLVRDVALKVIRRGMDTDHVISRFEVERQALAMMDHPGIARVLDAGATASGRPYFVMEYVDGPPITQYCTEHKLELPQRLELIEQACLAVQHAHQKGIIHRDLKPGNILVTRVDGKPIPKIIDFGVAKAIDPGFAGGSGAIAITLEAQIIGTPQYMSPEQATGGAARIDTRTDVYSLGTVLYELITGSPPFDPDVLRQAGITDFGRIIRDEVPAKPSTRIASSRPARPASEIDWIVMKALEKEPARRYQTPADLAADIRRHLSDQTVLAGRPSRIYSLRKFARRHRVLISAAAVVAVTLVAATITSLLMATHARRQARRAEEELSRANAIVDFTGDLLLGIRPQVARGRDTALLREILNRSVQRADAKLADQPAINLAVQNMISTALSDLGDAAAAVAQVRRIYDATANTPLHDHPERLRAAVSMAQILVEERDVAEASRLVNEALEGYRRRGEEESDDAYKARLSLAAVDLFSGRSAVAEPRYRQLLEHYRAIGQGESHVAILAWNNLALSISNQGRHAEACELWRQLNAVDRRVYGEDHPYTLMTLNDIGSSLTHLEKYDEAETCLRDAVAVGRKIYEPGHPTLLATMVNLASVQFRLNKLDDVDTILTEALQTGRQRKLGPMEPPMDVILLQLGELRAKQKRYDEAVAIAYEFHGNVAAKYGERAVRTLSALVLVYDNLLQAQRAAEGVAIVQKIGELPAEVDPDLRQQLHTRAGLLYFDNGDEVSARRHAARARAAVVAGPAGKERVTASLRLLEAKLKLAEKPRQPTTAPAP